MNFKKLTPYLLILIVVSISYSNNLHNDFLWDDEFLIQKNTYLRDFNNLPKMLFASSTAGFGGSDNFYRPTQNIYYLFIFQAFGESQVAFHLGNILIHLLCGFLIYLLSVRLFENKKIALITSLLWAAHPTHVEAITYISGTADPMGTMFGLASLYFLPHTEHRRRIRKLGLSLLMFFLALISKESLIVLPGLAMLVLFFKQPTRRFNPKTYLITLPHWIMAFSYLLVRKYWLNFNETYNFYKQSNIYTENIFYRTYTFIATLPEYLTILFRPTDLHMERNFPVHISITTPVLLGLLILIGSFLLSLFSAIKRKNYLALFCWLWFFAAFVPMMGILVPVNSFILEHWLYLPSIGFFAVFASVIMWTDRFHRHLPIAMTALLVGYFSYFTIERNKVWATPISFYSNILEHSKGSARVHNNIAMAYADQENYDKAEFHYKTAIETADTYPQSHYNLARIYVRKNNLDLALFHLDRSLKLNPEFIYSKKLKQRILDFKKNRDN